MNRIAAIALMLAATYIGSASASAQDHRLKATVPFDFTVGNCTLPAGTYIIGSLASAPAVISLNSWEKEAHAMVLGVPDQNGNQANELVFHRYGNRYFLSEIRSHDSSMDIHFAVTKAEKNAKAETEEARVSRNNPVLIALNQ